MDQKLFESALAAILDTAKKAYIEGFKTCADESCCTDPNWAESYWQRSEVKAACDKMIAELTEK